MHPIAWIGVLVLCAILGLVWRKKRGKPSLESFLSPNPPKDTVILHQYTAAPYVPSVSPFVMKLETYLRVANIPYVNSFDRAPGPKGKLPWIQYNNHVVADSQFCIEFLNDQLGVNLNKKLTNQQLAVGHVIRRTVEEFLYWSLCMWRVCLGSDCTLYRSLGLPLPFVWYVRHVGKSRSDGQGIGRHSKTEITKLMDDDLQAITTILGSQQFLFSDSLEGVTEFDCAVFGQLCELIWQCPGTHVQAHIQEKFPTLVQYCERMKSAFWSDWESRLKTCPDTTSTSPSTDPSTTTENGDSSKAHNGSHIGTNGVLHASHDVSGVTLNSRVPRVSA